MDKPKIHDIGKLMACYNEAESCDRDVFAEMRSNVLIRSGKHYQKNMGRNLDRQLRDRGVEKKRRLRLVKNHTSKGMNDRKEILDSLIGTPMPFPNNDDEASDQMVAELAGRVWNDGKKKNDWDNFKDLTVGNFEDLGECASKIFYNPLKGGLKSYHQKTLNVDGQDVPVFINGMTGRPTSQPVDEMGSPNQMMQDKTRPVFNGQVMIERIPAFDLLRHKGAKDVNESPWVIYRKMVPRSELRALVRHASTLSDEEKEDRLKWLEGGRGETYRVFNGNTGTFEENEDDILVKEQYFRQCPEYPAGYYFIYVSDGILFQGEIPGGEAGEIAFPIKWAGNRRFETSARGFSPIKDVRPAQLEINRCASGISETQLAVGWDKIVLNKGGKFERGVDQPGIRVFYATSQPTVIPGRSGDQFVGYLEMNIKEVYDLLQIPESADRELATDPKIALFRRNTQKKRFSNAAKKLAGYFNKICETYIFLATKYYDDETLVKICGATEVQNIQELKKADPSYSIEMQEISEDMDTMLGKTLELETIVQYMGNDLDPDTRASLLSQFPYLNKSQAFTHLLINEKNIQSDILALDRGENPPINLRDEHEMYVKHLAHRMKKKDFKHLPPEIQQNYEMRINQHEQMHAKYLAEVAKAQQGVIPTDGALVKADYYINPDPQNPDKKEKAVFPAEALIWLKERLNQQGMAVEQMTQMQSMYDQAQIAQMAGLTGEAGPPQPEQPLPPMEGTYGN